MIYLIMTEILNILLIGEYTGPNQKHINNENERNNTKPNSANMLTVVTAKLTLCHI